MWAIQLPSTLPSSMRQQQIPSSRARKILTASRKLSSRLPALFPDLCSLPLSVIIHRRMGTREVQLWKDVMLHLINTSFHHPNCHSPQLPSSIGMHRWRSFNQTITHVLFSLLYSNSSEEAVWLLAILGAIQLQIKVFKFKSLDVPYWAGFHRTNTHLAKNNYI